MKNYKKLEELFRRLSRLDHLSSVVSWDEAVMMPKGGGEARAKAIAELRLIRHELMTDPRAKEWIAGAEQEKNQMSAWQQANLREIKKKINGAVALTPDLVQALSLACSKSEQAWRGLRAENNWQDYLPFFCEVVRLVQEESQQRAAATGLSPYDALVDQFDPGQTSAQITTIFDEVKTFLPTLIQQVIEKQKSEKLILPTGKFNIEQQKQLGLEFMKRVGFDFNHGRLDVSHHPFCGGSPQDVRITTRYNTLDFAESLMSVLHETGHASYEQNLPVEWLGQPVGEACGMQIHESQSLFFEMQMSRSPWFLEFAAPILKNYFQQVIVDPHFWQPENLFKLFTRVKCDYIRVNADEVTYPAHIILRFEIERDLIAGQIAIEDIPEVWNEKMQAYLGLSTAGNFRDGCMQDVHWPSGGFGYFPSYSLGAMAAAQFFASAKKAIPQMTSLLSEGNFQPIRTWLKAHIWSQGSFFRAPDLLKHATGETLNPKYFRQHLENRYLPN